MPNRLDPIVDGTDMADPKGEDPIALQFPSLL